MSSCHKMHERRAKDGYLYKVPCGHCGPCLVRKKQTWAGRALCEWESNNRVGAFCTLTYDAENVPQTSEDGPHWSQNAYRRDIQPFLKRLRHVSQLRFFAASDEGDTFGRPHWHVLLYPQSETPLEDISEAIEKLWTSGFTSTAELNRERVGYTTGYTLKKLQARIGRAYNSVGFGRAYMEDHGRQFASEGTPFRGLPHRLAIYGRSYPISQLQKLWWLQAYCRTKDKSVPEVLASVPPTIEQWVIAGASSLPRHEGQKRDAQLVTKKGVTIG